MDLAHEAGIDVSDWKNFKGGEEKAAANPKYCYEWSFVDSDKKVVVLNIWYAKIQENEGVLSYRLNMRKHAERLGQIPHEGARKKRAVKMDFAIQKAVREVLPVRIIICDGDIPKAEKSKEMTRRAERRLLDLESWVVSSYDWDSGECKLVRGGQKHYSDQFDLEANGAPSSPERRATSGDVFVRSAEIRKAVSTS